MTGLTTLGGALAGFLVLVPVLGLGLAPGPSRLRATSAVERWIAGIALALYLIFLVGIVIAGARFPPSTYAVLPLIALAIGVKRRHVARTLWQDAEVRRLAATWGLFAFWGLALQATIGSYAGGLWSGDHVEHYQRALYFVDRPPTDPLFINYYDLPARPPLANVNIAAGLALSDSGYATFQIWSTLLASTVILPAWLWFRRWHPSRGYALLLFGLMAAPTVAQNLTFPWTKLPAAFWVLLGSHWLYRGLREETDSPIRDRLLGYGALAAGAVVHYSVVPLILGWLIMHFGAVLRQRITVTVVKEWLCAALLAIVVAAPWLVWIGLTSGFGAAGASTSTAQTWSALTWSERGELVGQNLLWSIVPFGLRGSAEPAHSADLLLKLRDIVFDTYQPILPLMGGLGVLTVLLMALAAHGSGWRERTWWSLIIGLWIVLGLASAVPPTFTGLAHLTLQPLALLAVCAAAAWWPRLPRRWRRIATVMAAVDLALGIAFHFGLSRLGRVFPLRSAAEIYGELAGSSPAAASNFQWKLHLGMPFWSDELGVSPIIPGLCAAAALALVATLVWRHQSAVTSAEPSANSTLSR